MERYSLVYGHDELVLWCDDCAASDTPVERWYGAPTSLSDVTHAALTHERDHHLVKEGKADA